MRNLGKTLTLVMLVLFLIPIANLQQIVVAQSSNTALPPVIHWQLAYNNSVYYDNTGIEAASNLIQTSDGGYAFMDLGWSYQSTFVPSTVYKVNSSGTIQWKKTIDSFSASTIIQTSDKGYEISGQWSLYVTNSKYTPALIKTDSHGNIQWVENYTSSPPTLTVASTRIQTSDGGFAFRGETGSIIKTDSNNNTQWVKNLTYTGIDGTIPLGLTSLIETSDGALAVLGVGYNLLDNPRTGRIYLIKTEAFLPLPSQTLLPTPIITPSSPIGVLIPSIVIAVIIAIVVVAVVAGLLVYFKKPAKQLSQESLTNNLLSLTIP